MENIVEEVILSSGKKKKSIAMEEDDICEVVGGEETEEVEEIVEIIEEIEEIIEEEVAVEEEFEREELEEVEAEEEECRPAANTRKANKRRKYEEKSSESQEESQEEWLREKEDRIKSLRSRQQPNRRDFARTKKKIVTYDADEDWEEEDNEQIATGKNSRGKQVDGASKSVNSMNGKRSASSRNDTNTSAEPAYKAMKNRNSEYVQRYQGDSVGSEENEELEEDEDDEDEENQHEIVKNAENDLVYTVLGSKRPSSRRPKEGKRQSTNYSRMERLDEDTPPVEGAIYYEGDNMETVYVAQSINEEAEHYEEQSAAHEEQEWEGTNQTENQEEDEVQQDQIFLHEDEDGQLYFKDDSGTLQPVYLTEDGNYAIAENNSDDLEAPEETAETALTTTTDEQKNFEDDRFIVPELDGIATSSNDPENEDNTVTISLIISEDENGQKRTQVIIPTTDNLKCELCSKSFKSSFQLLRHNRLKHAKEEDITTRNFPCDLCPKRYSDQNALARHRKTHIGDRPFGCLECGKRFPTSTALRRHLTQHNPQSRPLPCIYCGRRFLEKAALAKHEQSHLAGDQRTHTCDICHKSFLQAADLNLHKKNHDPDKKFDCEVCGREFNRLNNLQRHMMVHKQKQDGTQEILSCDVCGITYKFMSSLTRHMVTSHMNPEKLRQQADEQRKKRENNYRRYLENRKMYETQHVDYNKRSSNDLDDEDDA